ncbi:MAG TPA: hypothetical protein VJ201_06350 [Candidatus Babeliales bacterium]|nr:hypothetical protein [Candidatus Babeliales bacterium]
MEPKNLITINSEKDHPVAFELDMDGIDAESVSVRLCISLEQPSTFLMMVCEAVGESTYKTTVPAKSLSIGSHDCTLEVVTNEHYFVAMSGKAKVTGTPKVKAEVKEEEKEKEKAASKPKAKVVSEPEEVAKESDTTVEMPIESIILTPTPEPKVILETVNKNKEVNQILSELGLKQAPHSHSSKKLKDYLKG